MTGTTGTARQEAERLVAALLAMASQGRGGESGGLGDMLTGVVGQIFSGTRSQQHTSSTGWATGTAECCVCPICRAIAALRDPTPETAERLATGAGDLATGVASMMRAFSTIAGVTATKPKPKPARRPEPTPDQAWSAATRTKDQPAAPREVDENADPWGAATHSPAPAPAAAGPDSARPDSAGPDSAGPDSAGPDSARPAAAGSAAPRKLDEKADPWGAATHTPAQARPETSAAAGSAAESPGAASAAAAGPEAGQAGARGERAARHGAEARSGAGAGGAAASTGGRRPAAASGGPGPRTEESDVAQHTRPSNADTGAGNHGNRPADPWAAAVANYAKGESPRKTGVVGSGSVDHDVAAQGRPAAAEDHGSRPGDDAPGDVV